MFTEHCSVETGLTPNAINFLLMCFWFLRNRIISFAKRNTPDMQDDHCIMKYPYVFHHYFYDVVFVCLFVC